MSNAGKSSSSHHRTDLTPAATPWTLRGRTTVQYRHRALVEQAAPLLRALWSALGDEGAPCFADPQPWVAPTSRADLDHATDACLDCPAMTACLAYARATRAESVVQGGEWLPPRKTDPDSPLDLTEEIAS